MRTRVYDDGEFAYDAVVCPEHLPSPGRSRPSPPCSGSMLIAGREIIERKIEHQHIHPRLANHAEPPAPGVFPHQPFNYILAQTASAGDPCNLHLGGGGTDLGVKAAARGGHHVDRNPARRRSGIGFEHGPEPPANGVDEDLVGGPQVGTARTGCVVTLVASGGRTPMEIARGGEILSD